MSARFSHSLTPEDRVAVTVRSPAGLISVIVEPHEIKRFAWAVLNDLDPDAVEELRVEHKSHMARIRADRPKQVWHPLGDDERRLARKLHAQGVQKKEIARRLNRSKASIDRALKSVA